jgi:hypothetical protein
VIDRWYKDTVVKKYGQYPMTCNAPGGCVEFWMVGHAPDWTCEDLKVDPVECTGKRKGT